MTWGVALHFLQVLLCNVVFLDKRSTLSMVIQCRYNYEDMVQVNVSSFGSGMNACLPDYKTIMCFHKQLLSLSYH